MIKQRLYPRSIDELKAIVNKYSQGAKSIACQAGHFLVYYDHTEDLLLPGIAEELDGPRHEMIKQEIGHFPELTWGIGLDLLSSVLVKKKYIFTVVNDWQYIPKSVDKSHFYENYNRLPQSYQSLLHQYGTGTHLLKPRIKSNGLETGDFFSEQVLRNQYTKHVKSLVKRNQLPKGAEIEVNGEELSCSLFDTLGRKEEVYCTGKRPNCTHEVAEMLHRVSHLSDCSVIINIYPLVCKKYVEAGSELSHNLFLQKLSLVVNIGMPSSHIYNRDNLLHNCSVTIHLLEKNINDV